MGSPITEKRELYAALNNCAFVSTDVITNKLVKPSKAFAFLMDASMLGFACSSCNFLSIIQITDFFPRRVGVGFDTLGADGKITVPGPNKSSPLMPIQIEDSREGWVESVGALIDAYFLSQPEPVSSSPRNFQKVESFLPCPFSFFLFQVFDYSKIRPGGSLIKVKHFLMELFIFGFKC